MPRSVSTTCEVFNALRWLVRTGASWRMMPNDLPPWEVVYQQMRRWLAAGVFESMVRDLRLVHAAPQLEAHTARRAWLLTPSIMGRLHEYDYAPRRATPRRGAPRSHRVRNTS